MINSISIQQWCEAVKKHVQSLFDEMPEEEQIPLLVTDDKFCHHLESSNPNEGVFNMPQMCDMGLMALLPLQRKAC
jgi:hypothetical protein